MKIEDNNIICEFEDIKSMLMSLLPRVIVLRDEILESGKTPYKLYIPRLDGSRLHDLEICYME